VAAALAARRAEAAAAIKSTPEMVLTALWRIAGKAEEARRYEAAVSALKLLGQHHGLFEDVTPENESARRVLGILERMALRASGGRAQLEAGPVLEGTTREVVSLSAGEVVSHDLSNPDQAVSAELVEDRAP
jgi:hypothetical protein